MADDDMMDKMKDRMEDMKDEGQERFDGMKDKADQHRSKHQEDESDDML